MKSRLTKHQIHCGRQTLRFIGYKFIAGTVKKTDRSMYIRISRLVGESTITAEDREWFLNNVFDFSRGKKGMLLRDCPKQGSQRY